MITGNSLIEQSKIFFLKNWHELNNSTYASAGMTALTYIKRFGGDKFRYKDEVEADSLVQCLVDVNYLELVESTKGHYVFKITKEGRDFIDR